MSLSAENMKTLMAYADGELTGASLAEATKLLATDPDAVTFIEQVANLGEILVQGHETRSGKTVASFDIADAVMAAIQTETPAEAKPVVANVASLAAARDRAAGKKKNNGALKVGAGVIAVLALAASVLVFAKNQHQEVPMAVNAAPGVQEPGNTAAANALPSVGTSGGAGVAVDSAGKSVSVFYLPTANELSTSVVVWVDESGEK